MKVILRIHNIDKWQDFGEADFPLAAGFSAGEKIVFGSAAESEPVAWIGLNNHKLFLQPEGGTVSARLNDKKIIGSEWLIEGCKLHIGNVEFSVKFDSEVVELTPVPQHKRPVLTPPDTSHPNTEQAEDSSNTPAEQASTETKLTGNDQVHSKPGESASTPSDTLQTGTEQTEEASTQPAEQKPPETGPVGSDQSHGRQTGASAETIFAPLPGKKQVGTRLRNGIIVFFVLLVICVAFVLTAAPVRFTITPSPDTAKLSGFPPPVKFGDRYMALPGSYHVVAQKEGYRELNEPVKVEFGSDSTLTYNLVKLPGLLEVVSTPVSGAEVMVGGRVLGLTPLSPFELEAGNYELSVVAKRYLPEVQMVEIQGMGVGQSVEVALHPGWGTLVIESEPEGVDVLLDGEVIGQTPLRAEPMGGEYDLELRKDGWKPIFDNVKIEPDVTLKMPQLKLQKVDGKLVLASEPSGARVMLNGKFRGDTPVSLTLVSENDHQLSISKSGYVTVSRSIRVGPSEEKSVDIQLKPEYGIVYVMSKPADAKLSVDGSKVKGFASQRLRLTTLPHQIVVSKDGYESFTTTVTPTVNVSKQLNVQLKTEREAIEETIKTEIRTAEGQVLRRIFFIKPVQFQMGASRREAGRRSNERQYQVVLSRSFYISEKEVTNAEFQKFSNGHDSGSVYGFDLNEDDQPVSSVTWDAAAAYMNWLSKKEGLPPAYKKDGKKMVAVVPVTDGYRLPTEAEWAFASRFEGGKRSDKNPLKFPWGRGLIPPKKSGNYADSSALSNLPLTIKDYTDGNVVAAPVGKFPGNAVGVFDLGGNVSEWCHDYYDIHLGGQADPLRDPAGPVTGEYHVIRGSSWRHGSIKELRLSYRDYGEKPRNDLGFRIVRYAEEKKKK